MAEAAVSAAGGVLLTPGSFDALATAMGVSVYPILVSPEGLVAIKESHGPH